MRSNGLRTKAFSKKWENRIRLSDNFRYLATFGTYHQITLRTFFCFFIVTTKKYKHLGAIHKQCGQFFGHFDPSPFEDNFTLITLIWLRGYVDIASRGGVLPNIHITT